VEDLEFNGKDISLCTVVKILNNMIG
jgi:hypothetical protein